MTSLSPQTEVREARIRAVLIALIVGICVGLAVLQSGPRGGGMKPGALAPAFDLRSLNGERVTLESLRGRVVVVAFWASWCSPCLRELPALARLDADTSDREVVVVTIADDRPSELRRVIERMRMQGAVMNFPVLLDQGGRTHVSYGATSIPAITIVAPDGKVGHSWLGETSERHLREAVSELRSQTAP